MCMCMCMCMYVCVCIPVLVPVPLPVLVHVLVLVFVLVLACFFNCISCTLTGYGVKMAPNLTCGPLATGRLQDGASKPRVCLKMPPRALQEGPNVAQHGPRWAQARMPLALGNPVGHYMAPQTCKNTVKTTTKPPNSRVGMLS